MKTVTLTLKTHKQFCKRNCEVGAAILMLCYDLVNFLQAFSHFLVQMSHKDHIKKKKKKCVFCTIYIHIYICMYKH